jgi:hypothetical protein
VGERENTLKIIAHKEVRVSLENLEDSVAPRKT